MKGPIPTIAFMFSATHSVSPRARSSFADGMGVGMDGRKRAKHIRCMGSAKASWQDGGGSVCEEETSQDLADRGCGGSCVMLEFTSEFVTRRRENSVREQLASSRQCAAN